LDTATASFAAEVGATAEEAESAQRSIGALYKTNLASFDEIGTTLSALRTQMGLTQDEAEATAQSMLDFALATGQDGASAVSAFDDILDSWGLTAADAAGLMDQLIVSHQKFGGSVDANQATLAALAPAMKAANMNIDDGISLLNLFGAKGLDANTASAAFAKALTKVKSPKELQDLIADISATEDPFIRSQKAADLFGARAGAKLANALAGANLDDYAVSITDAAGATQAAADTIESSATNQIQLALKGIGGTLAEVGQNFGPFIMGFSMLLPTLTPIITSLGAALGGLLAAAIPVGMALLPVIIIGAIVAAIAVLVLNEDIRNAVFGFIGGVLEWIGEALGTLLQVLGDAFSAAFNAVGQFVSDALAAIGGILQTAIGLWVEWVLLWPLKVLEALNMVVGFVVEFVGQVLPIVGKFIGDVVAFFLSIPGKVVGIIGSLAGTFARVGAAVLGKVVAFVGQVISTLLGMPGKVAGQLISAFGNIAKRMVDAFLGFIKGIPDAVGNILGGIGDFVGGLIPKFETGAVKVPRDMLAMVHAGEMIVPANEAEAIRQGRGALSMAEPVAAAGVGNGTTVNVYNPVPEPASTSVTRELRKLAYIGVPA
jgi:phage-related minor tail protein